MANITDNSMYRDGASGMIRFCEEKVRIPIYPPGEKTAQWYSMGSLPTEPIERTGKSYAEIWNAQKEILHEALAMSEGAFIYKLIVLCWMRGEGKSLLACLIQLWKFFCFPKQQIMLGANSKDQVKFVHFDIMRDIIYHSPELLLDVGKKGMQEKEIRLKDKMGHVSSLIRSISSFTGIVSNITGYTFSEIFDMKNPRFFVQLDGSIRNIPNALGVIDSTVSEKTHVLYQLYTAHKERKTKEVYFSYRFSKLGLPEDYWNPHMDDSQLNDYRVKFPFGEFERYFQNLWEAGALKVFTEEQIDEIGYLGIDGVMMNHTEVAAAVLQRNRYKQQKVDMEQKRIFDVGEELDQKIEEIEDRLWRLDYTYQMSDRWGPTLVPVDVLYRLSDMLETDWAILAGVDMADPLGVRAMANTIVTVVAKGLIGSRRREYHLGNDASPKYIYFLLNLTNVKNHSLEGVKEVLSRCHDEYDGLDTFCMERWGVGDLMDWAEERDIEFEGIFPNYDRQKAAFKELYTAVDQGRFKAPTIREPGTKAEDILREELSLFDHDSEKRWFGSPEKAEKYGVQDDSVFSVGWCIYGGRLLTAADFRARTVSDMTFGAFIKDEATLGSY